MQDGLQVRPDVTIGRSLKYMMGCKMESTDTRRICLEGGMTAQDVLERWGRPAKVLRIRTSDGGITEEWRYPYGRLAENGDRARIPVFVWVRDGRVMATLK